MAVAFSGGRDSLALLHATCRAAQALGLQVAALHIHHGLLPEADAWLQDAQRLCARWRRRGWPVQLHWVRLSGQPGPGDSLEAWARAGRQKPKFKQPTMITGNTTDATADNPNA